MSANNHNAHHRGLTAGFTLVEILVSLFIISLVASGVLYGYVQVNRTSQWSAISLAAQAYAMEGAEQARAAKWNPNGFPMTSNYPGSFDELPPTNEVFSGTNYYLDVPSQGGPNSGNTAFFVTNYLSVTNLSVNPYIRQITSQVVWQFYLTGQVYTNTSILVRASNQ